jgi:hypothetical protein
VKLLLEYPLVYLDKNVALLRSAGIAAIDMDAICVIRLIRPGRLTGRASKQMSSYGWQLNF